MAGYFSFQSSDEEEQINSRSNKSKADGRKGRLYESDSEEEEEFRPMERIHEIKGNKSSMSYAPKVKKAPEVFEQVMLDFESI